MKKPFFLLGYKDEQYTYTSVSYLVGLVIGSIFVLSLFVAWPFICVWAFNTLFNLSISYNIQTWIAAFVLIMTFAGSVKLKRKTN